MFNRRKTWLFFAVGIVVLGLAFSRLDIHLLQNQRVEPREEVSQEKVEGANTADKVVDATTTAEKPPAQALEEGVVSFVADGDTLRLADGNFVRLIGIDAPEKWQDFYPESRQMLRRAVYGKTVKLERDKTNRDKYGRLLRYVWLGDTLVNLEIVRRGLAESLRYAPDTKYQAVIEKAEKKAKEERLGIWKE